ncbi:MAG: HmuY family protein, partial [Bacteroidota bacterium]
MKKILLTMLTAALTGQLVTAQTFTGPATVYNVEATSADAHTFYSLRNKKVVPASDSATANWDIAFCKSRIIFNSGTSGPGKVKAQLVDQAWVNIKEAPATGYLVDAGSDKVVPTGSGKGWYWYNATTEAIRPVPHRSLVIQWEDGQRAKLEIISYHKNASTAANSDKGFYSFRYLLSATNNLSQHLDEVYNLDATTTAHFNLAGNQVMEAAQSTTDAWDVSFTKTDIVVNSGGTNTGKTVGQFVEIPFANLLVAPDANYKNNTEAVPGGSDNSWYHYDFLLTHTITPIEGRTLVFQDKHGRFSKMVINSYYKDAPATPILLNTAGWYKFQYFYQPDGSVNLDPDYVAAYTPLPADTVSNDDPENPNDPNNPDTPGDTTGTNPGDTTGGTGTGIAAHAAGLQFAVFPNPSANGNFTIKTGELLRSVNIFNMTGTLVY